MKEISIKKEEVQSTPDRNASYSAYGWNFQAGAGIKLMLDYVKEFVSLKMEGRYEDIELTLSDGKKIYAQAKSAYQRKDQRGANVKLEKALKTLSETAKKDSGAVKLIYITNIMNPFDIKPDETYGRYGAVYDYGTIGEDEQQKIRDLVQNPDFPFEKFQAHVLEFYGEGDAKFDAVKERIKGFIKDAGIDFIGEQRLFNDWFSMFIANCADKPDDEKSFEKSKREIMYPIIVFVLDKPVPGYQFKEVCPYVNYNRIVREYRDLIENRTYEFEFTSSLLAEYHMKLDRVPYDKQLDFTYQYVRDVWQNYKGYFGELKDDAALQEAVIKMTILTVIDNECDLESVYKATNLNCEDVVS